MASPKISEELSLTDEKITSLIDDPSTIETHEIALEVIGCLDAEITNIQAQVDAAMIEATIRPLSEDKQAWVRRASYAAAMKRNERHKVYQRDKEIRGVKNRAFTEPKHSKEEKLLKQQRLMVEAEARRDAKKLALAQARIREMEIAQQRRQLEVARDGRYNEIIERCAVIAESLNGWGSPPAPEQAAHIAKVIREQKRDRS